MTMEVFKVTSPDGHVFRVHSDGSVEGFPAGSVVSNKMPAYALSVLIRYEEKRSGFGMKRLVPIHG